VIPKYYVRSTVICHHIRICQSFLLSPMSSSIHWFTFPLQTKNSIVHKSFLSYIAYFTALTSQLRCSFSDFFCSFVLVPVFIISLLYVSFRCRVFDYMGVHSGQHLLFYGERGPNRHGPATAVAPSYKTKTFMEDKSQLVMKFVSSR